MIIDREYAATHSMSTAWYVVDDEGNVGIIDYNENGPVPWGVEQTCIEELMSGHDEGSNMNNYIRFNLSERQILDMFKKPIKPEEEKLWYLCAVRIDKKKKERFLELCKNDDISEYHNFCYSDNMGLYDFDAFDCVHDKNCNDAPIHGTLKTMLDEGIILEVYEKQNMDIFDEWVGGEVSFEKSFDKSPYYIYKQPYSPEILATRLHVPANPVKEEQIPSCFRHRLHRIPGSFRVIEKLQIAQYYPCDVSSLSDDGLIYDNCLYQKLPLFEGGEAYLKVGILMQDFLPYCPKREENQCTDYCTSSCYRVYGSYFTDKPTVLIVIDPREEPKFEWKSKTDIIFQNAVAKSYLSRFPHKMQDKYWVSKRDIEAYMTQEQLVETLAESRGYFESIINDINPHVILATPLAKSVIEKCFHIESDAVQINGTCYPIFDMSCLQEFRGQVERLALLPFRGKEHQMIISVEKMNELIKLGLAK